MTQKIDFNFAMVSIWGAIRSDGLMSKTRRKLLKQFDIFYAAGTDRFFPQMNNDAQPKPIFCWISIK